MNNYFMYLENNMDTLTFEEADKLFNKLIRTLEINDKDAKELYDDFIGIAIEYSAIRNKWPTLPQEERLQNDLGRTLKHDSLIASINILSRYLNKLGKDISWRSELGEQRKRIGDFACYVALFFGLNAR